MEHAELIGDQKMLTRIRGVCLFSVEAHYHPRCRKEYTRQPGLGRSADDEQRNAQFKLQQTHQHAFERVCSLVKTRIIQEQEIMKLSDICRYYIGLLDTTDFANPEYRAEKLKAKLQKHEIGEQLSFTTFQIGDGQYSSQLVFSNSIKTSDAVRLAYKLGTAGSMADVANTL